MTNLELEKELKGREFDDVISLCERVSKEFGTELTLARGERLLKALRKGDIKMQIITRRFYAHNFMGDGCTIDVRTGSGVSDSQAQTNATQLAHKKLKSKSISITPIDLFSDVKADYSIGPKATSKKKAGGEMATAHAASLRARGIVLASSSNGDTQAWASLSKPEGSRHPLDISDDDIEVFDDAVNSAEKFLQEFLDRGMEPSEIVARFVKHVQIHMEEELEGAKKYGNICEAFRDAVNEGRETV